MPYGVGAEEAQAVLREVREEVIALYGGQVPPEDQPYFGGVTWQEYRALSDEQAQARYGVSIFWERPGLLLSESIDDFPLLVLVPNSSRLRR